MTVDQSISDHFRSILIHFGWFLSLSVSFQRHKRDFAGHFRWKVGANPAIVHPLLWFAGQKPRRVGQIRSKVTLDVSNGRQFREEKSEAVSRDDHSRAIGGHFGSKVIVFLSIGRAFPFILALSRDVGDAHLPFAALVAPSPLTGEPRTAGRRAFADVGRQRFRVVAQKHPSLLIPIGREGRFFGTLF